MWECSYAGKSASPITVNSNWIRLLKNTGGRRAEEIPSFTKTFTATEQVDRRITQSHGFPATRDIHIVDMCERFLTERNLL